MELSIYSGYLAILLIVFSIALCTNGLKLVSQGTPAFHAFQKKFLAVYLIMMAADWMQGPYVYRLYSYYGFSRQDNGVLFIAGFGSSLVFGTWAGPMADRYGRKLNCILYGVTYILSCCTKHFNNFGVLMVGRLLGGFATSILWSAFESWMVSEHISRGFDPEWIGSTFSLMITMNGLVAIASGFIAQWSVDLFEHPVAPFDVSALFLVIGTIVISTTWSENYGTTTHNMLSQMKESLRKVSEDKKIFLVGLQQALFEGAMYTFVFMWTPALDNNVDPIPHGLIFACFMIACSLGGTLFSLTDKVMPTHSMMRVVYMVASFVMAIPMLTQDHLIILGGVILFEISVGMFWPGIGTLRSKYVPEAFRATIINIFRIPLNLIVCCVLYFQGGMTIGAVFTICTCFHVLAVVVSTALHFEIAKEGNASDHEEEEAVELKA